jgi:hypothetical protein
MKKGIVVKIVVVLAIIASAHSIFWFFKAGQVEKQIQNFISENSAYISSGEIAVSGFPLSQKVSIQDLKFVIPNSSLNKYQTAVKKIEASSSIFSSNFVVTEIDQVTVQDLEGSNVSNVEFVKSPEVEITLSSDMIAKFSYKDSGYRILDADKVVTYISGISSISFESKKEEGDKIKNKLMVNITDIEGFDVVSIYKNSIEGKIIDGIKTGEITLGNSASGLVVTDSTQAPSDPNAPVNNQATNPSQVVTDNNAVAPVVNSNLAVASQNQAPNQVEGDSASDKNAQNSDQKDTNIQDPSANTTVTNIDNGSENNVVVENAENKTKKTHLVFDIEYELVPSSSDQQSQAAMDPTQIQETSNHYNKIVKINNFEFSNSFYKVTVNGQLEILQDDSMPSGAITVKVEKINDLVKDLLEGVNKSNVQVQTALVPQAPEAATNDTVDASATSPVASVVTSETPVGDTNASAANIDPYQNFLNRVSANMLSVTKEVAQKNPLTTEEAATFDVRREKNLEILVNETPIREILGKL